MQHLYIHIPFCARRCVYCDFAIAVRKHIPAERYVAAVLRERDHRILVGDWDEEPLETLYFGGGTPSLLPPQSLAELGHSLLGSAVGAGAVSDIEFTVEANPDDVTPLAARTWADTGVNRVSLGVQSFQSRVLEWMHRTHEPAASERAVRILREVGIGSISLDLIFGLPDELASNVRHDLCRAIDLAPEHLSLYGLTVESGTALGRWVARGITRPAAPARYAEEFLLAHEMLTAAGFEHYEVSNYAQPGHHARHNSAYWSGRPYAGLGPSAHSFRGTERSWNVDQWTAYERAVTESGDPTAGRERPSGPQRLLERVYLGLRTAGGIASAELSPWPSLSGRAAQAQGWLVQNNGIVRLTPIGWLQLDALVPALTTSAHGG